MNERPPKASYPWTIVGLLWLCGFFNYADRQAVFSVLPLVQKEFGLNDAQLGMIGSAFMIVYAVMAPFSGFVVDLAPRRWLIVLGLGFWSLICAATATARRFAQLLFFRAAEGLGESFYFPASMSILADYHGPRTRSRAMSLHQTSVYAGTVGGGALAGLIGELSGSWRMPFWILGGIGMVYSILLIKLIIEPVRGKQEGQAPAEVSDDAIGAPHSTRDLATQIPEIVRAPSAVLLLAVFAGANFVAAVMLTWLPKFVYSKFGMGLTSSAVAATVLPLASLPGAICGGMLADWAAKHRGGRMRVQALSLLVGAPFVFLAGWTGHFWLFLVTSMAAGFCKGLYDANIFASMYDVVRPQVRGTAAGLMNTIGWTGGSIAPVVIGQASGRYGLSTAIAATSVVYIGAGLLAMLAARLAPEATARPAGA